jgi:hypothetical protein
MAAKHHGTIPPERVAALTVAAELQVDEEELALTGDSEHRLWEELRAEFEELVARIGPVWIAD